MTADQIESRQSRGELDMNENSVVVGVDGSPAARAALEYALEDAARRNAPLRVVAAVALPEFWASYYRELVPPPPSDIVKEARKETQRFVDEVVAGRGDAVRCLPISVEVRAGRPGEVLVDAAEGAALLVVGHRGRGSVSSVLLGSVGLECVLHAPCPVTVVRPEPQAVRANEPVRATWAPAPA
jgi:nucleotide-binding universal stress UspA family protein